MLKSEKDIINVNRYLWDLFCFTWEIIFFIFKNIYFANKYFSKVLFHKYEKKFKK